MIRTKLIVDDVEYEVLSETLESYEDGIMLVVAKQVSTPAQTVKRFTLPLWWYAGDTRCGLNAGGHIFS